jgi:hypothetical protein
LTTTGQQDAPTQVSETTVQTGANGQGTTAEEVQKSAPAFQPLPAEACAELQEAMEEVLAVDVTMEEAHFEDIIGGMTGSGCLLSAKGTGRNFPSFIEVAQDLSAMMVERGWVEDTRYIADGPTGTATAFRLDNQLALLSVGWDPAPGACPEDQPISACELAPEQQLYSITLQVAQE